MSQFRAFASSSTLPSIILLALSVLNLTVVFHYWRAQRSTLPADHYSHFSFRGHDFPPLYQDENYPFETVMITVEESSHYQLGHKWDSEWFSMAGEAFGYVRHGIPSATRVINDATAPAPNNSLGRPWGTPTSLDDYYIPKAITGKRMFVVTMFHELHCLRMFNAGYESKGHIVEGHLKHCLHYIRQMALCDADVTPEPAGWEEKWNVGDDTGLNREGATHVCQDFQSVFGAVENNWAEWLREGGEDNSMNEGGIV